jgi:hypothetical protein
VRKASLQIIFALVVGILPSISHQQAAIAKNRDVGASLVGGVVGVAVGAALSHKHHHDKVIYYPGYQPPYPAGGYDPYFNQAFNPAPDVVCYPAQRICYNMNGSVANKWTWRVFAN